MFIRDDQDGVSVTFSANILQRKHVSCKLHTLTFFIRNDQNGDHPERPETQAEVGAVWVERYGVGLSVARVSKKVRISPTDIVFLGLSKQIKRF